MWLYIICGILALTTVILLGKVVSMRKSAKEIEKRYCSALSTDTNALIAVSCGDSRMRKLVQTINGELKNIRAERLRCQRGDNELKETISNISHDLRTPLTAVCGYLELLEREEMSDDAHRYVETIGSRITALKALTEEFFRYSVDVSVHELKKERVSLNRAVEESIISYAAAMERKGIVPEIAIPEESIFRTLDPTALSRILGNLISNAIKYSDGDLRIALESTGKITFSNRARGLDSVTAGKLFHRFFTVETGGESTGLGLSIARLLTERMNGTIDSQFFNGYLTISLNFPV